jgi:hypothetical protein
MTDTYSPILGREQITRWRLFGPLPMPKSGTALVFAGQGLPPVPIWPDDRSAINKVRWDNYHKIYHIDISKHSIGFDCTLPSKHDGIEFSAEVQLDCWVDDPIMIIQQAITDARAAIEPPITRSMRAISRNYSIRHRDDAENAIIEAVKQQPMQGGFEISRFVVRLGVEEEERLHSRKLRQIERETEFVSKNAELTNKRDDLNIERAKRTVRFYSDLIKPDYRQLLVLYLAHHPEEVRTVAQLLNQQSQADREYWLKALQTLHDADVLEEFHLQSAREKVLQHFTEIARREPVVGALNRPIAPEQEHAPKERAVGMENKTTT